MLICGLVLLNKITSRIPGTYLISNSIHNITNNNYIGAESLNSGTGDMEDDKVDPKYNKETTKILEQLPDLSYMRAKTLVFPRNPKY